MYPPSAHYAPSPLSYGQQQPSQYARSGDPVYPPLQYAYPPTPLSYGQQQPLQSAWPAYAAPENASMHSPHQFTYLPQPLYMSPQGYTDFSGGQSTPSAQQQKPMLTKSTNTVQVGLKKEVYSGLAFKAAPLEAKKVDKTANADEKWTRLTVDFDRDLLREIRVYGTECPWTFRATLTPRVCSWSKDRKSNHGHVVYPPYSYVHMGMCTEEGKLDALSGFCILANDHHATLFAEVAPDLPDHFLDCGKVDFMEIIFHRLLSAEELSQIDIEALSFDLEAHPSEGVQS